MEVSLFRLKLQSLIFLFLLVFNSPIQAQLTINITSIPENTQVNDNIFLASNLSQWKPADAKYQLQNNQNNQNGTYQLTFTPPIGTIEFKFTKGSWTTVETDANGQDIPNREIEYKGLPQTIDISILEWKEHETIAGTAAENTSILSEKFYIPQLNQERKIWIYLPPDYETTNKSYPVLYMNDGQNLFDQRTSFSGEWEVDESLNDLFDNGDKGIIIIGIENGGESRRNEYSPWINAKYGGGQGAEYIQFIVKTLKPYVDNNYRTKPDRLNTGIMGSSMGGLISFYAAIEHQDVFSKAGVFSPSFWFSDEVYSHVKATGKKYDMKIYLLGGELESDNLINEMNAMVVTLGNAGFKDSEIKMITCKDGKHNEAFWLREFPSCYLWLFD